MAESEDFETRTPQKIIFNNEAMLHFIDLYKKHECLWNPRLDDYKKHERRKNAIRKIALDMGVREEFVKKKIQSLRSTYIQEKKKIDESKSTETGTDEVYTPSLFWYHELDFLQDVIVPRKTSPNWPKNAPATIVSEIRINPLAKSQQPGTSKTFVTSAVQPADSRLKKKRKMTSESEPLEDIALKTAIENFTQIAHQNDEFEAFGTSVAAQLRALPEIDALNLQMELQQLITRKRIQALRKTPSESSLYTSNEHSSNQSPVSGNDQTSAMQSPYSSNESSSEYDQHRDILSESIREADINDSYMYPL